MGVPGQTKAYNEDLRWRMVWQRLINGYTIKEIASNLYVAESTVWRVVDRFERTGSVTPNRATSRAHRLHEHDELLLIELVCDKPSIYLREIQATLFETTGTLASASTLCRTMKRLGFTRKKLKFVALQRSDVLRAEYQAEVSMYNSDMFLFVDETGCDRKNAARKFGYSLRGFPAKSFRFFSRGKRISTIGLMSTTTFLDCYTTEGTVDGDVFYRFVQSSLLPHLMPFNGTNPNSIVILDNCSIHHLDDVVDLIHSVGAHVIFLPPYSPDLMPIEQCFNKVKLFLQEHDAVIQSVTDLTMIITAAFASITSEDCIAWSADCGYL